MKFFCHLEGAACFGNRFGTFDSKMKAIGAKSNKKQLNQHNSILSKRQNRHILIVQRFFTYNSTDFNLLEIVTNLNNIFVNFIKLMLKNLQKAFNNQQKISILQHKIPT